MGRSKNPGARGCEVVALPDLRAHLRHQHVGGTATELNTVLRDLERAWLIDLLVAQDPTRVPDRAEGIAAARGLIFYVTRRAPAAQKGRGRGDAPAAIEGAAGAAADASAAPSTIEAPRASSQPAVEASSPATVTPSTVHMDTPP